MEKIWDLTFIFQRQGSRFFQKKIICLFYFPGKWPIFTSGNKSDGLKWSLTAGRETSLLFFRGINRPFFKKKYFLFTGFCVFSGGENQTEFQKYNPLVSFWEAQKTGFLNLWLIFLLKSCSFRSVLIFWLLRGKNPFYSFCHSAIF